MLCAVTTCPREKPTLERTLLSLRMAGIEPMVSEDGERNAFRHWLRTAREASQQGDGLVLMCQDDILVARGLGASVARLQWPSEAIGCLSLYCPAKYEGRGWLPWWGSRAWGACALLFRRETLEALGELPRAASWESDHEIDHFVGLAVADLGLELRYHAPSLVQHVGDVSTLCNDRAAGWRAAKDFVGEDCQEVEWPSL